MVVVKNNNILILTSLVNLKLFLLCSIIWDQTLAADDIIERDLGMGDYEVKAVLQLCPLDAWDDDSIMKFSRSLAYFSNIYCREHAKECGLFRWNSHATFNFFHVQFSNSEIRPHINVILLSIVIQYNKAMLFDHSKKPPSLLPKTALSTILHTHGVDIEDVTGWELLDSDNNPKFDPVTSWMNVALIPVGLVLAIFVFIVAKWAISITASSELDLMMRIQKKRVQLQKARFSRGASTRVSDESGEEKDENLDEEAHFDMDSPPDIVITEYDRSPVFRQKRRTTVDSDYSFIPAITVDPYVDETWQKWRPPRPIRHYSLLRQGSFASYTSNGSYQHTPSSNIRPSPRMYHPNQRTRRGQSSYSVSPPPSDSFGTTNLAPPDFSRHPVQRRFTGLSQVDPMDTTPEYGHRQHRRVSRQSSMQYHTVHEDVPVDIHRPGLRTNLSEGPPSVGRPHHYRRQRRRESSVRSSQCSILTDTCSIGRRGAVDLSDSIKQRPAADKQVIPIPPPRSSRTERRSKELEPPTMSPEFRISIDDGQPPEAKTIAAEPVKKSEKKTPSPSNLAVVSEKLGSSKTSLRLGASTVQRESSGAENIITRLGWAIFGKSPRKPGRTGSQPTPRPRRATVKTKMMMPMKVKRKADAARRTGGRML